MKKRKVPRAVQAQQQAPKLNPFELKGSRKKFDVLGKRDKADKKNVIKLREEAVNKVGFEHTLLFMVPPHCCHCCYSCCCCCTPLMAAGQLQTFCYRASDAESGHQTARMLHQSQHRQHVLVSTAHQNAVIAGVMCCNTAAPVRVTHLLLLQRKKTLLVEYKQLRKANTFIDRRFGGGYHGFFTSQ